MLEINRIYNMDFITGVKGITDNSVDLVLTDPPYELTGGGKGDGANSKRPKGMLSSNEQKLFPVPKFDTWLPEVYRVMKPSAHCYIFINFKNLNQLMMDARRHKFSLCNLLVWEKNNCTPSQAYMKNAEYILLLYKKPFKYINDIGGSKTVHKFNNILGSKLHPTQKPVELIEFYVQNSSQEGDIVLDPFMGSGTTALAAKKTNRSFIGFEINKDYHDISCRYLNEFQL